MLKPDYRVLVRKLSECGGKKAIYIVQEQFPGNQMYVVYVEAGNRQKTRTPHHNL